jgi:hypothetical protein
MEGASFCKYCGESLSQNEQPYVEATPDIEEYSTEPQYTAAPQDAEYETPLEPPASSELSGAGKFFLKWGLIIGGSVLLMLILQKVMGIYAGIVGLVIEIVLLVYICHKLYTKSAVFLARVIEFYDSRNISPGFSSAFIMGIGVFLFSVLLMIGYPKEGAFFVLILLVALPLLYLLVRFRGEFPKFLFLQLVSVPIVLMHALLSVVFGRNTGTTTSRNLFTGTVTTTHWENTYPTNIEDNGWLLTRLYDGFGFVYYLREDGMVCYVVLKGIAAAEGIYEVMPVYRQNAPRPSWIAWLYKGV